jgi:ferric-dicitrate binding protein FerR (iron transport regulator)
VTAGEQLKVGSSGDADAVRVVNVKQVLSAEGYLVFDSTPLSDVVAEFNHYNNVQLRLGDTELSRRPISGTFLVSDLETLIAFIEAGAHVSVTREERGKPFSLLCFRKRARRRS